jgi:hypothetical protein
MTLMTDAISANDRNVSRGLPRQPGAITPTACSGRPRPAAQSETGTLCCSEVGTTQRRVQGGAVAVLRAADAYCLFC